MLTPLSTVFTQTCPCCRTGGRGLHSSEAPFIPDFCAHGRQRLCSERDRSIRRPPRPLTPKTVPSSVAQANLHGPACTEPGVGEGTSAPDQCTPAPQNSLGARAPTSRAGIQAQVHLKLNALVSSRRLSSQGIHQKPNSVSLSSALFPDGVVQALLLRKGRTENTGGPRGRPRGRRASGLVTGGGTRRRRWRRSARGPAPAQTRRRQL